MNILVFDVETVPDTDSGRKLYGLEGLSDEDVAKAMFHIRQQKTGSEFLPHHLQRIVAISVVMRSSDDLRVWSLGNERSAEHEILTRFYDGIEKYRPVLVSWNGNGFDLPVIHYRSLYHQITAPQYWEVGDNDRAFRYNNYISRYHWRHTDLMDVLSAFQARAFAPLEEVSVMCGQPGKGQMSGDKVWETYLQGDITSIRKYCETDVVNTYLLYLRFELMRGDLNDAHYEEEKTRLSQSLSRDNKEYTDQFVGI